MFWRSYDIFKAKKITCNCSEIALFSFSVHECPFFPSTSSSSSYSPCSSLHLLSSHSIYNSVFISSFCYLFLSDFLLSLCLSFSLLICFSHLCSVSHQPPVILPNYFLSLRKPQFLPLFLYSVSILLPEGELLSKLGDHINCRN